jgi:hypothetical protein
MGMDVYGIKPTSEKGEYFRNNVWWWHPLWDYCCTVDKTLADKVPEGHSNSGDGLDAIAARQLAFKLQHKIDTGQAKEYVDQYETERKNLPKQDCKYCDENGERQWSQQNGETITKTCNACQGTKKVDPWDAHYPMDLQNIQDFTNFLMDCGGFQIC